MVPVCVYVYVCVCARACVCVVAMCLSADHIFRALITWCMFTHMVTVAVWILFDAFHLDYRICSDLLCFTVMLLVIRHRGLRHSAAASPTSPRYSLLAYGRVHVVVNRPTHPNAGQPIPLQCLVCYHCSNRRSPIEKQKRCWCVRPRCDSRPVSSTRANAVRNACFVWED